MRVHAGELVVHADLGVPTGENPDGRCHLDDGPAISREMLRRLGCSASVITVLERGGGPEYVTDAHRVPPPRMERLVEYRDRTCRFPSCSVAASKSESHHIFHWEDGGPTEPWNLAMMCEHHHDAHHRGEFFISRTDEGDLTFVSATGKVLGAARGGHWRWPTKMLPRLE